MSKFKRGDVAFWINDHFELVSGIVEDIKEITKKIFGETEIEKQIKIKGDSEYHIEKEHFTEQELKDRIEELVFNPTYK